MATPPSAPQIGAIERFLLEIDEGVFGALYRAIIGFAALPAMRLLLGDGASDWFIVPFLLAILLALRLVPAVLRKLLAFSQPVQEVWAARRRLAKQYDSYQWRKLLWIGVGLALYTALSGQFSTGGLATSAFCILGGALGTVRWWAVAAANNEAQPAAGNATTAG
ncbi:MAG TPA: hypothetical protein VNK52_00805 [Hyphomicrobiaceae bacterium]|nr:hypothetical protein [Hyphomicrobiaceae bacterium]